jgi:hypothetical protein
VDTITSHRNSLLRFLLYAWAAPASAIGCCVSVFALCLGATWRVVDGVAEVGGGRISCILRLLPPAMRFEAITFGHIILAINHTALETHRLHEHIHVHQYERWGLLFFPLYLCSSLRQVLRGRDPHYDNYFEREAYRRAASSLAMLKNRVSYHDTL